MKISTEERMVASRFRLAYNQTAMSRKIDRRVARQGGKSFDVLDREGPGTRSRILLIAKLLVKEKISPESFVQVIFRALPKTEALPWTRTFLREKAILWYKTSLSHFEKRFPRKADRMMFFAGPKPNKERIETLIKTTHKAFIPMRRAGFSLGDAVMANVGQISPWFLASANGIAPDAVYNLMDRDSRDKIKRCKSYLQFRGWLPELELLHDIAGAL